MSVLKQKRTTSKAEFINTANQIYVETLNFLTRLSARYSRLIAEPVAKLAGEVIDHAEKANSIFPSDPQRIEMRKAHLLEARASLMALDVRLTHCYLILNQNPEGAILLLDLKGFFPNAPHALLYQRHRELILNPELQKLADTIIQYSPCPTPGRGMPLGVEPSQQEMVSMPSRIDNWIKCQAGVHCAGHYMDDYYVILPDVEELKKLGHEIVRRFEAAGIRVNKKKCKIIPLTKPFRFCKAKFTLTETGKIKVNGNRDGVKRARRKLKLFHREFKEGKRTFFDIEQYMECQSAYYRNFNDHGRLLRLRRLYHAIFFGGAECLESSKTGPVLA